MKRSLIVAVLMVMTFVASAAPALAGKGNGNGNGGGGGKGGGGGSGSVAVLTANPDPAQSGGVQFWTSGCGYLADRQVNITITTPTSVDFFPVAPDQEGCVDFMWYTGVAGDYLIEARQVVKGKKQTLMGQGTLTVVDS